MLEREEKKKKKQQITRLQGSAPTFLSLPCPWHRQLQRIDLFKENLSFYIHFLPHLRQRVICSLRITELGEKKKKKKQGCSSTVITKMKFFSCVNTPLYQTTGTQICWPIFFINCQAKQTQKTPPAKKQQQQ